MDNFKVTEKIILECLKELDKNAIRYQKYKDYYEGDIGVIFKDYTMQDSRSNMKIPFNFCRKFVDVETGYLLGKDINYISKSGNQEIIDTIDYHMTHWVQEHDILLRKSSEIYGIAWELNYVDRDGDFKATVLNPLNSYILEDGTVERNAIMAIYKYQKRFDDNEYIDVFVDNRIITYIVDGDSLKKIDERTHIFDRVPIISCPANSERLSGFHDIIPLVQAFSHLNSDLCNEVADHRNAYLLIENAELQEDDLARMKKAGIIQVPQGASVKWLIKDINDDFVQNELNLLEKKIYDLSDQVNFNENWASNTSGLALKNKLLNLENRIALREAIMENVIKQRLRNFFEYIKVREGKEYNYKDISVQFTRNLPTDLAGLADMVTKLKGTASDETLLAQLPFIANPTLELEKRRKEQEAEMLDLEKITDDLADKYNLGD
ncbi:phage portal protein [Tissierella pigra]|uniref:Phage portal protein n=1 Tax=Tissierella pigra TaxID=2607614 RepID=A0A6N7Y023_9FIRM|nr:phage portal protein [Tissierella pigra]MSU01400.1 phage portal protein [Tissierella pigra]